MTTNNSVNLGVTENADGGEIKLGIVGRILKWLGADITITGSGSVTTTFPTVDATLLSTAPGEIDALDEKATPVAGDWVLMEDSEDGFEKKKVDADNFGGGTYGDLFGQDGVMLNGKFVVTVVANDLVVALKGADGNDPSPTNAVKVKINGVVYSIEAALSLTLADATNWFDAGSDSLKTKEIDYFPYLVWNTNLTPDAIDLGISRCPFFSVYSEASATSTNEKYFPVASGTAPAATDNMVNIGRFAATLSAGAGYTWTVPTFTTINMKQRPWFETRELDYMNVRAVAGGTPPTYTVFDVAKYQIIGKNIFGRFACQNAAGGTAGSGAAAIIFTMPFSGIFMDTTYALAEPFGTGYSWENGGTSGLVNPFPTAANTFLLALPTTSSIKANDQSSAARQMGAMFSYRIG